MGGAGPKSGWHSRCDSYFCRLDQLWGLPHCQQGKQKCFLSVLLQYIPPHCHHTHHSYSHLSFTLTHPPQETNNIHISIGHLNLLMEIGRTEHNTVTSSACRHLDPYHSDYLLQTYSASSLQHQQKGEQNTSKVLPNITEILLCFGCCYNESRKQRA